MKKLSDDQFDALLKHKTESFNYDFDETAWDKMEQKLRKRDRVVFIRNSSFVLILLMLCGGAFLWLDKNSEELISKQISKPKDVKKEEQYNSSLPQSTQERAMPNSASIQKQAITLLVRSGKINIPPSQLQKLTAVQKENALEYVDTSSVVAKEEISIAKRDSILTANVVLPLNQGNQNAINVVDSSVTNSIEQKSKKPRRVLAFSVTALAGPEFSSITSVAGKKGTLTIGLLFNASISKKLTFSSGLKYGLKNYEATGFSYQLDNPVKAERIAGINASCNILEIPLHASYQLMGNARRKIQLSSGLSSYFMLKEKYDFIYKPQWTYNNYQHVEKNKNQHYLSVLNLSASYQIKPKTSAVIWAIEPYVKLPLGGVGEGNVKLKSSGISLNLTYDLSKKIRQSHF